MSAIRSAHFEFLAKPGTLAVKIWIRRHVAPEARL